jgi:hypothetical protein
VTLAERWNGARWKIQPTPNPAGAKDASGSSLADPELYGVSCTAANACTAVGSYIKGVDTFVTLAERWNGTSWKIQSTPNPAGAGESHLFGVSCTAANACTAVGFSAASFSESSKPVTLAERWNGTSWKIQSTPNPAGAKDSEPDSVSCTTANACTAVGYYVNAAGKDVTLAERRNSASWTTDRRDTQRVPLRP